MKLLRKRRLFERFFEQKKRNPFFTHSLLIVCKRKHNEQKYEHHDAKISILPHTHLKTKKRIASLKFGFQGRLKSIVGKAKPRAKDATLQS